MIVRIIVMALLAGGLYYLISGLLGIPPLAAIRAIDTLTAHRSSLADRFRLAAAKWIVPLIRLRPRRREQMERDLLAADINDSPELYVAQTIVAAGVYLVAGLLFLPLYPPYSSLCAVVLAGYAVRRFFKLLKIPGTTERKLAIEAEAPGLTSYIVQSLAHPQDITTLLQNYRPSAGKELGSELDTLLTDMRTKSHEAALVSFESRVNSPLVSELVRGLLGMEHGEDMTAHMVSLEARMNEHEIALIKKEAMKRPDKLAPANWLLFGAIFAIWCAILGVQFASSMKIFSL